MSYEFNAGVWYITAGKQLEIKETGTLVSLKLDREDVEKLVEVLKKEFPELVG